MFYEFASVLVVYVSNVYWLDRHSARTYIGFVHLAHPRTYIQVVGAVIITTGAAAAKYTSSIHPDYMYALFSYIAAAAAASCAVLFSTNFLGCC